MLRPMRAVTITPMTEEDITDVLAIDREAFDDPRLSDVEDHATRDEQLRAELARTWARLRVARRQDDGAVLGYILFWHVADEIHLLNVAVSGRERRRGIGRALTSEMIAYGRAHAAAKILLEVRASNASAIALYGALGFTPFNVRERYYPDGENAVEMMLLLHSAP